MNTADLQLEYLSRIIYAAGRYVNVPEMQHDEVIDWLQKTFSEECGNSPFINTIEKEPHINVKIGDRDLLLAPDLLIKDKDGNGIILEVKKTNNPEIIEKSMLRVRYVLSNIESPSINIIGGLVLGTLSPEFVVQKIPVRNEAFEKVRIYEKILENNGKMAIFLADANIVNPNEFLDFIVHRYVRDRKFNQFTDIRNDNPWVRIVITGINNLEFNEFNIQRL